MKSLFCFAWLLALPALAETNPTCRLTLDLTDGSRVVGTPTITALAVRAGFGNVNVPLANVGRVELGKEQAKLTLRNGDRVTGTLDLPALELATVFAKVTVPVAHVREFRVAAVRGGPAPKGLVLWNTLGSQAEIEGSAAGPGGTFKGGNFVEGKFGQALAVRHDQLGQVTFPAEGLSSAAGCIEFWAKLTGVPRELAWGQNPALVRVVCGEQVPLILYLNGNDGNGRGGLCVGTMIGGAGTGQFGSWTYEQVFGAGQVETWHHYALVWDKDGIAGLDGHRVAVYLDGKLHASEAGNGNEPAPLKDAVLELFYKQHLRQGTVTFDNLKAWNHAKTDFNNRNDE